MSRPLAEHQRTLAERYEQTKRQRASNGKWFLSPSAFCALIG
jgi:hypothetical protein